jgi:hypothetical protein
MKLSFLSGLWLGLLLLLPSQAGAETFGRLAFEVPEGWSVSERVQGAKQRWALTNAEAAPRTKVEVVAAFSPQGLTLAQTAKGLVAAIEKGRQALKGSEVKQGHTKSGLAMASLGQASQGAGGVRLTGVWVVALEEQVQAVILLSQDAEEFAVVSGLLAKALTQARYVPPATPKAATPKKAGSSSSEFHDHGVLGSSSVATVAPSAKLTPIPFEVTWAQGYDHLGPASALDFGADPKGSVYLLKTGREVSRLQANERQILRFVERGKALTATPANVEAIIALLRAKGGTPPENGWRIMQLDRMWIDALGHGFVRATLYGVKHDLLVAWWEGQAELVVHPGYIGRIAREQKIRPDFVYERFAPTPQGGAWLFVWDGYKKTQPGQLDCHVRFLARGPKGWQGTVVTPRFATRGGKFKPPTRSQLLKGAPDWKGGWICYTGQALWRLHRDGRAWPLAELKLDARGTSRTPPLVMKNGDVWVAINQDLDVSGHTDSLNRTHVFALIGDRSRWIRIRLDGEGGVSLGEIDGKAILAQLKARKVGKRSSGVFKTTKLRLDPSTNGLLAFDGHHSVLFSVTPKD